MKIYVKNAKDVLISGQPLDIILSNYYAIDALINEVIKLGGDFSEWDNKRNNLLCSFENVRILFK